MRSDILAFDVFYYFFQRFDDSIHLVAGDFLEFLFRIQLFFRFQLLVGIQIIVVEFILEIDVLI